MTNPTTPPAPESIERGANFANVLLPAIKAVVSDESSPEDHLLWWTAFFGVLAGACGGDVGRGAASAIGVTLQKIVSNIADEKEH